MDTSKRRALIITYICVIPSARVTHGCTLEKGGGVPPTNKEYCGSKVKLSLTNIGGREKG